MTTRPDDPFALFDTWIKEACASEELGTACALGTASADGRPSVRMVLLKDWGPDGFVVYTNFDSRKGAELEANPEAALCFHWKSQVRQVRVEGHVERVSDAEADDYFQQRPRGSQVGAWASRQSAPLSSREALLAAVTEVEARHPATVPRPPRWTGARIVPRSIEFWVGRDDRLHERWEYSRSPGDASWVCGELYP